MVGHSALHIQNLSKHFGRHAAVLHNLSLTIKSNEIAALIGPSGSGKTTLLRTIAGFETPNSGSIWISGTHVASRNLSVTPARRSVGVVFQEHALFPHLTVRANVAFGLSNIGREQQREQVDHLLDLFGISHLAERYPHQISGGQIQRVGIARALAPQPALLLLDEPFNNLDAALRETILHEVRTVLKARKTAALCITHIPHEAFAIADRIAVLDKGDIIQYCKARTLYCDPVDKYVARFFGPINVLAARYNSSHLIVDNRHALNPPLERIGSIGSEKPLEILIRPADIELFPTEEEVYCNRRDMLLLKGKVRATRYYGHYLAVEIAGAFSHQITVHTDPYLNLRTNQAVQIGLPVRKMSISASH